jgi:hypothetical protein
MTERNGARFKAEQVLRSEARKAFRESQRQRRREAAAREAAEAAEADLDAIHAAAEERFDLQIPKDALLLDVLEQIEVQGDDRWVWRGRRNNHNLPSIWLRNEVNGNGQEISIVRYLAVAFRVIDEHEFGMLYPTNGDRDDVNPWHRKLRPMDRPAGNPTRYSYV